MEAASTARGAISPTVKEGLFRLGVLWVPSLTVGLLPGEPLHGLVTDESVACGSRLLLSVDQLVRE